MTHRIFLPALAHYPSTHRKDLASGTSEQHSADCCQCDPDMDEHELTEYDGLLQFVDIVCEVFESFIQSYRSRLTKDTVLL